MSDSLFYEKLQEESRLWERDGVITQEQREMIQRRYCVADIVPPETATKPDAMREFPLYIRVVLALAVFLVGLAVFLLISFNWKFIPGAAKLSIVGGVLAAAHGGGFWLRKTGWKNWADAAFFFAGIMYGVGIWQVGQVFHLPADFPMGMWLWAIGVFLMALVLGSTPLHLLSVALLTAWIIAAATGSLNMSRVFWFGLMPFSAPTLPILAGLGICVGSVRKNRVVATLYTLLFLFWWIMQGIGCGLGTHLTFHIVATGMICTAISTGLRSKNIHDAALGRLGVLLVLGGLIAPSFLGYWGALLYGNAWNRPRFANYPVTFLFWCFIIPLLDFAVLAALFRLGNRKESIVERLRNNKVVVISALTVLVLWLGSYGLSLYLSSNGSYSSYRYYDTIRFDPLAIGGMFLTNALIVVLTIWLIVTGLKRERGDWFWSGVLFFLFWAVVRYADLFSGFGGMLGAAAIFLFCGLFMLGIVYVWSTRKRKQSLPSRTLPLEETSDSVSLSERLSAIRLGLLPFWQSERNILSAVVIVALIQFGILGAMIANEMRPHVSGTTIRVTTVPVDPRDLFRGDYVILRYGFSTLEAFPTSYDLRNQATEQTVYVTMRQEGDLWKAASLSRSRPKDGVFLRGVLKPHTHEIVYGIESYFVQEGTGKDIEEAMRQNREGVIVELNVAPNGKTSIKTVQVQGP